MIELENRKVYKDCFLKDIMKITTTKHEDLTNHIHHETDLRMVLGIGLVLYCIDCKENLIIFEEDLV